MFELLQGKGFALTLASGERVEVDFGPLSNSTNRNISKEAFKATGGKSLNAEIRVYNTTQREPTLIRNNASVEDFLAIVNGDVSNT